MLTNMWINEILIYYWWECRMFSYFCRQFGKTSSKTKYTLPHDPITMLHGSSQMSLCPHRNPPCMSTAALLINCNTWEATKLTIQQTNCTHTLSHLQ